MSKEAGLWDQVTDRLKRIDLLKFCWMPKENRMARKRLGRKISYISLYEYCHLIDKHEQVISIKQQELTDLKVQVAAIKNRIQCIKGN